MSEEQGKGEQFGWGRAMQRPWGPVEDFVFKSSGKGRLCGSAG